MLFVFSRQIEGEQIRIDPFNQPFEELAICEHALQSERVLFEIRHGFFPGDGAIDKQPSLVGL